MGHKTKVQSIKRKLNEQLYINLPMALAHALEFKAGEEVEWIIAEDGQLLIHRLSPFDRTTVKKTKLETKQATKK